MTERITPTAPPPHPSDSPATMSSADASPTSSVVLFDGVCNLCSGFVNWVIERDPDARFRFVPLQSEAARAALEHFGRSGTNLGTIVLIDGGRAHVRSSAALRIIGGLRTPLRLAKPLFGWIPAPIRDLGYRLVAACRYTIRGKRDACCLPSPGLRARFPDPDDPRSALLAAGLAPTRTDPRTSHRCTASPMPAGQINAR